MKIQELKNIFISSMRDFSKENWWIYLIFIVCLFVIFLTGSGNILEIIIIFIIQFFGALFYMMMSESYSRKNFIYGAVFLTTSTLIYCLIGIYGGIAKSEWQYLLPQIVFILISAKSISELIFNKNVKIINFYTILFINIIIISFQYFYLGITKTLGATIQIVGFFISTQGIISEGIKKKYIGITLGGFLIVSGALISLFANFFTKTISGLDVSYSILPMTAFIFQLKLFRNVFLK